MTLSPKSEFNMDEIMRAFYFATLEEGRCTALNFADSPQVLADAKRGLGKFARVYKAILPKLTERKQRQERKRDVIILTGEN